MKKNFRKADLLLLSGMIVIGVILGLVLLLTRTTGAQVQVRVDGKIQHTYSLNTDMTSTIEGIDGGTNLLVISGGSARVTEASCPDGLCVNMGTIRYNGESIVCLPNKVVIEISGGNTAPSSNENDDGVDIIAGGMH